MKTLGFYNLVKSVEGTLHQQHYAICRLEYQLALERLAAGKTSQTEVAEKERKFQEAINVLEGFLAEFHIVD